MSITALLCLMAVILMGTALYSINSQDRYMKQFGGEIRSLLDEANMVRNDLEALLGNAIMISDTMVERLDSRINKLEALSESSDGLNSRSTPDSQKTRKSEKNKKTSLKDLRKAHPYIAVPRLYNEGYNISEIAELLDKGQGEIKLILDIQRRKEVGNG